MSSTREVITIQAGQFANFIGTHWWNIQESSFCYNSNELTPLDINHDVLFREGQNLQKEVTYTPRLVLVDLKQNVSIRKECPLYRTPDDTSNILWEGPTDVIKEKPIPKNPFLEITEESSETAGTNKEEEKINPEVSATDLKQNFGSRVQAWSDFLRTSLHPKSFCLLEEMSSFEDVQRAYKATEPKVRDQEPLEAYYCGEELYLNQGRDMIEDSIRRRSEECDSLQGFHVIYDAYNGFSGLGTRILQHLNDEYHSRAILGFPVFQDNKGHPIEDVKKLMHRLYSVLLSLNNLSAYSSLFSPLCLTDDVVTLNGPYRKLPYLEYDENSQYHTSAIFASAIETITSPYRAKSIKFHMSDITSNMSIYGRKMVSSSVCLPFPLADGACVCSMTGKDVQEYYMSSISPFYKPGSEWTLLQSAVLRGITKANYHGPQKIVCHSRKAEELFGLYLNKYSSSSQTIANVFEERCCIEIPFPNFFKESVNSNGYLGSSSGSNNKRVNKVSLAASLHNSDRASEFIQSLLDQSQKVSFREYVKCSAAALEKDEFQEAIQTLVSFQENYQNY